MEQSWIKYDHMFILLIFIFLIYYLFIPFQLIDGSIDIFIAFYYTATWSIIIIYLFFNYWHSKGMERRNFKTEDEQPLSDDIEKILKDQQIPYCEVNDRNSIIFRLFFLRYYKSFKVKDKEMYIRIHNQASWGISVEIGPVNSINKINVDVIKNQLNKIYNDERK